MLFVPRKQESESFNKYGQATEITKRTSKTLDMIKNISSDNRWSPLQPVLRAVGYNANCTLALITRSMHCGNADL